MSKELAVKWWFKETWDFDVLPAPEDFEMYLKALLICANGDGRLTDKERQWVVGFGAVMGAPEPLLEDLKTWQPSGDHKTLIESRITGVKSTKSLIYEAIRACSADDEYHADERAAVHKMAGAMDIPSEMVDKIEALCKEEQTLKQNRLKLLFGEMGRPF